MKEQSVNKLQKFNLMKDYAVSKGYNYAVHVMVRGDNIAWTSHYPTIFHHSFLTALFNDKGQEIGRHAFDLAFQKLDAIGYLYEQYLTRGDHHETKTEDFIEESQNPEFWQPGDNSQP